MSTLMLPPERDLPDQAALRRQVVRAVTTPRRHRSGWLLPAATAAAVLLVTGAVAVGAGWLDLPGGAAGTAPATAPATGTRDPGMEACLAPGAPSLADRRVRVLLRFTDAAGSMVVLGRSGAGGGLATCYGTGQVGGGGSVHSKLQPWAPGYDPARRPVALDLADTRLAVVGSPTSRVGGSVIHEAVGRIGPSVTRVVVTWSDGHQAVAVIGGGLYAARHVVPLTGDTVPRLTVTVMGYDAQGHLLGTAHGG